MAQSIYLARYPGVRTCIRTYVRATKSAQRVIVVDVVVVVDNLPAAGHARSQEEEGGKNGVRTGSFCLRKDSSRCCRIQS